MLRFVKVLFALELAVVMAGIYIITDIYYFSMKDYDKIKEFPYTGVYFSTFHDHTDGSFLKIKEKIETNPKFCGWSFTKQEVIEGEDVVIAFDSLSSQLFSMDVQEGMWLSEVPKQDGKIPCVLVDDEKGDAGVGDTITMGEVEYLVTGTVSPEEEYFNITGTYGNSSAYALSDLKKGIFPPTYRIILCSTEIEPEYVDDKTSIIAYFDKDLSDKEMAEVRKIMEEEGVTETFEEMKQITYQDCYYRVMEYIPFCVIFFFVSIMGVIASTVTSSKRIIRRYGIFALCGCRWRQIILGYFCKLFLTAVFMSVLAVIYAYFAEVYYGNILVANLIISFVYALFGTALLHLMKGRRDIMACIKC